MLEDCHKWHIQLVPQPELYDTSEHHTQMDKLLGDWLCHLQDGHLVRTAEEVDVGELCIGYPWYSR